MNFSLLKASKEDIGVIRNLMQFYMYDFSEFIKYDVEETGLFAPYPNLEEYWEDSNKFPYIIENDGKHVGFVLVKFTQAERLNYFSIAEFFILKKYRFSGVGKSVAIQIFDLHKGNWEVHQRSSNKPAQVFWVKVINEYSKGEFQERTESDKRIQTFKNG